MEEVLVKTHLIVTETRNEYNIDWCGKILDANPEIKNGKPIFVIVGSRGRSEINTTDMNLIEKCAKKLTHPRGRTAITSDKARIYIKEKNGKEKLMGILTHDYIKTYAPMFDRVGYNG